MAIQIKICGLTTPAAVETAISGGASHIGYIFFAKSPRNIEPDDAANLADIARDKVIQTVVTVNADDAFLDEIVGKVSPDLLQLHGSETSERVREIKNRFNLPVMKAFSISEPQDLEDVKAYEGVADQFLFDAKPPEGADLPGGNGLSFDWNLLRDFTSSTPYMLSGGLDAENVKEAILRSGAEAIDLSSGVESAPGIKDIAKIETLLKIVSDLHFEGKSK
ncbi:MAG: phosphoribosylanthranilate isomerase [Rhizobiaceae bacterium]|nr:phosphoribosylanthranilate isomerase [Rhizobiaceae bacterium]